MNPTRDEILRMLMVMMLRHPDSQSSIQALNLLEYSEPFTISDDGSDDLKIPYVGYVKRLINESGSGADLTYRVFLIPSADIVDNSVNLTGRENQQGDTIIPSDANVSIYEGGKTVPATYYENGLIEGLDGSLDVKVVLIGGEPVAPVVTYKIINESSINGEYQFSNSDDVFVVSAGQEINIPYQENVYIIINLLPGQYENYKVTDENGNIIEDRDSAPGPSISIGFPMNSTQSQLFTIKNDA